MLSYLKLTRYVAIVLVAALLIGALILISLGLYYTWSAVAEFIGLGSNQASMGWEIAAKLAILKAVDSFVFAIVLIYISLGVHHLAMDSKESEQPSWLEIKSVADMERKVLEVVVVLVAILFLQAVVEQAPDLNWLLLVYPAAIVAISVALKLIPFDH